MEKINVAQLAAQLEAQAAAGPAEAAPGPGEPLAAPAPAAPPAPAPAPRYTGRFSAAAYADETAATTALWAVPAEGPVPAGGLKGLVQRVVRKLIRFYSLPARAAQNRFNERVAAALNELGAFVEDVQHADRQLFSSELEQALYEANASGAKTAALLAQECAALRAENAALRARVEALERRAGGAP